MYKIVHGMMRGFSDLQGFIKVLNTLDDNPVPEARHLFSKEGDLVVARAPGRLDVMGGIADYSGSLVLEMPLREATRVALQRETSPVLTLVSLGAETAQRAPFLRLPLSVFGRTEKPMEYPEAQAYFRQDQSTRWAAYVAGVFLVLMHEKGANFKEGARILISSDVPEGKGVSSSAALEVAAMKAICTAYDIPIKPREMALLCQKLENLIAGAPCGVMDQITTSCGEANRLLALLCQPAEIQGAIGIPEDLALWGIESGERHQVSGEDYESVRTGAFMGYQIIAHRIGLAIESSRGGGPIGVSDPLYKGYLANIRPSTYAHEYHPHLPERIEGGVFLERYKGIIDPVTRVDPARTYLVQQPTAHPIYEHFRVCTFAEILKSPVSVQSCEVLGELMYQSHTSYSACGLASAGCDLLVRLVRQAGPDRGLYGAKITGGGSGGTVAVLGRRDAFEAVKEITDRYARETGYRPYVFAGSSPGASAFGHLLLRSTP